MLGCWSVGLILGLFGLRLAFAYQGNATSSLAEVPWSLRGFLLANLCTALCCVAGQDLSNFTCFFLFFDVFDCLMHLYAFVFCFLCFF